MNSPDTAQSRNHIFAVIAGTVLVLGLARAVLLVAHTPAYGYSDPAHPASSAMGAVMLLLFAVVAGITWRALRGHPVASLMHALLFFLVVADPVGALWLSSPKPEAWTFIGCYAAVAMLAVIGLGYLSRANFAILLAAVFAIANGPRAFVLLPAMLVITSWPLLARRSRRHASWVVAAALAVVLIAYFFNTGGTPQDSSAGMTIVPAEAAEDPRPEPVRTLHAMAREIPASATLAPASLDISQGGGRRITDLPPYIMSFAGLLSSLPVTIWMVVGMTMILTWPFAVLALVWTARRDISRAAIPATYAALVAITAYASTAAAIGAGDAARIQSIGWLAMLAAIVMLPLVAWHLARDAWSGPVALVCSIGIVLLAASWLAWTRTQPIAIGAIERVTPGPDKTLEVSGWALDPRGVRRVYAKVGGGPETTATLGGERRDLQAAYPGYPGAVTGGFQMSIASNAWRPNQQVRVYAENRLGAITEIGRRDAGPAP